MIIIDFQSQENLMYIHLFTVKNYRHLHCKNSKQSFLELNKSWYMDHVNMNGISLKCLTGNIIVF